MSPEYDDALKEKLIGILTGELKVLRAKAEVSQEQLAHKLGVSRQTYGAIESKKQRMTWNTFLSLLYLFERNDGTAKILHMIGASPPELESYLKLKKDD